MAIRDGLQPQHPPRLLGLLIAECCTSRAEIRALLKQDEAFQVALFEGRHPRWTYKNWHVRDRRFRSQRLSWILAALLARHVAVGSFMLMCIGVLTPIWLAARARRVLSNHRGPPL